MSQRTQLAHNRAVYRDPDYRTEAAQVLADNPTCVICGKAPSTEADHVPPLGLHQHEKGSGCCELRASCKPCNAAGGQRVRNLLAQRRLAARAEGMRTSMIARAQRTRDSRLPPSFLESEKQSTPTNRSVLLVGRTAHSAPSGGGA